MSIDPTTSQSVNDIVGSNGNPTLAQAPESRGLYTRLFKPVLDRIVGLALFILFLPIIAFAAIAIRIKIGAPIFYTQNRIGVDGSTFNLYKLRTMIPDRRQSSGEFEGPERRLTHKSPEDPRVLPLGKTLRSWRLDELPQFWNVVNGDMSLVGPRPELPEIVAEYEDWQHQRHAVKPGVTGPWQISERNGKLMHECTDADIEYINRMRFGTDVSILVRTPMAMFGGRRGY
jgi:lipopolysaccharide/colanic/teichoic acid biosynthesis glycosyltransferase